MPENKMFVSGMRMAPSGSAGGAAPAPAPAAPQGGGGSLSEPQGGARFRSMRQERVRAMLKSLQEDTRFIDAAIVVLGCLFLLLRFSFYPWWFIPFILAAVGVVSFRSAAFGTIFACVIALPAVSYQSPLFAWLYLLVVSLVLFKAFETWKLISLLFALICCPFTAFGFLIIPLHVVSGLLLGSKRGAFVTGVTVFSVLLLSVMWGEPNSGFMNYNAEIYKAINTMPLSVPAPRAFDFISGSAFAQAGANFIDWGEVKNLNDRITECVNISYYLVVRDSALIQIILWTISVFAIGFVPGHVRWKNKETVASLASILILVAIALSSLLSGVRFSPLAPFSVALSIAFVWVLETNGIQLSREVTVTKIDKMQKFSKFGLQDLSLSDGAESLGDVGGYANTKKELYDSIVMPLQRKELQTAYGLKPPKGLLLFGPPGTGKTMLMRALAKEMDIGFYYVKCSDLLSQWYGETEHNIAELFKIARANAPCVLFFDEVDSVGKRRDKYTADDVAPRLLSVMLAEMDGFKSNKPVIIVGATNIPQELDPALLRPGRFDKIIYMPLPDLASRKQIFMVHTRGLPLSEDVDFAVLAKKTERFSGADIANIVHEAATRASKLGIAADKVVPITMADFLAVIEMLKPTVSISQLEEYDRFGVDYARRTEPEKKEKDERAVSWKDVIGMDDVRKAFIEAIELPLLHEGLLKEYGVEPIKGILLFGPPGCGKTMIVKAASNELDVLFVSLSGADLLKMGYDGAVREIKSTFDRAKENAPAVVFMDEVDAMAPARGASSGPLSEKLVAQLLNEMDGVKELRNVLFVGATNRPEMLDPALLRPGRLDKIMFVHPPLAEDRARIFALNLKSVPKSGDIDFMKLAKLTDGFTGADIASVCQESKMRAVRKKIAGKKAEVQTSDILEVLAERKPSVTPQMLSGYMAFMEEYGERR
ncbi:MAG: AAA family ATPase [Candidatus ainarchaeum sp.]|nr:AAA family ATPase [Candidatus ainarchaeum sp.]